MIIHLPFNNKGQVFFTHALFGRLCFQQGGIRIIIQQGGRVSGGPVRVLIFMYVAFHDFFIFNDPKAPVKVVITGLTGIIFPVFSLFILFITEGKFNRKSRKGSCIEKSL